MESSSPPTKASLLKWWRLFSKAHPSGHSAEGSGSGDDLERKKPAPYNFPSRGLSPNRSAEGKIFGVSLQQSLAYASVAISVDMKDNKSQIFGYIPTVVAKCGSYLKATATHTEGIFRVSGSTKRINALQAEFDSSPDYGKSLDWTGYTAHDAASVLRRYLNSMPEPVIPADVFKVLEELQNRNLPHDQIIIECRTLIHYLPKSSIHLLLYLLDFLSLFSHFSEYNKMTASNLAVVFQPGLVSSRTGQDAFVGFPGFVGGKVPKNQRNMPGSEQAGAQAESNKGDHGRAKEVLEFLIDNQQYFMLGDTELVEPLPPTAALSNPLDVVLVQGGATTLGRSGSEKSVERRRHRLRSSKNEPDNPGVQVAGEQARVKRTKSERGTRGTIGRRARSSWEPQDSAPLSVSEPLPKESGHHLLGLFRSRSKKEKELKIRGKSPLRLLKTPSAGVQEAKEPPTLAASTPASTAPIST